MQAGDHLQQVAEDEGDQDRDNGLPSLRYLPNRELVGPDDGCLDGFASAIGAGKAVAVESIPHARPSKARDPLPPPCESLTTCGM